MWGWKSIEVVRLESVPFQAAWDLQARLAGEVASGRRAPVLLQMEHPHTFTIGRRGDGSNRLWSDAECAARGVPVIFVDRGGDITYHGPGELVTYPIVPLVDLGLPREARPPADGVGYIRRLEQVLLRALAAFGVRAGLRPGLTGAWLEEDYAAQHLPPGTPPAKIASIGVKVDVHGVTRHGFGLNIDTDPRYWRGIIPCGIEQVYMANLADLAPTVPPRAAVEQAVCTAFGEVFQCQVVERAPEAV